VESARVDRTAGRRRVRLFPFVGTARYGPAKRRRTYRFSHARWPMSKTRIGVIGPGSFCTNYHLRNLQARSDVDIAAVCDISEERLRAIRANLPETRTFTDHRALLDADLVDGIIVSTPNQHHFTPCQNALQCDIPVLVDKPVTVTGSDAETLVGLSKSRNVALMTAFTRHFMPSTEHVRREIRSGTLDVQHITAIQRHSPLKNTVEDGGMLHRRTVHIFDVIPWLMGSPIVRVSASIQYETGHLEEEYVDGRLELANGVTCNLLCIKNCDDSQDEVSLYGRTHSFRIDKQQIERMEGKSGWQAPGDLTTYGTSTDHFVDAQKGVTFDPNAPFHDPHSEDGLQSIRVLEAVHEAGRTGKSIDIPIVEQRAKM
jgi:predicted dehydrogenase